MVSTRSQRLAQVQTIASQTPPADMRQVLSLESLISFVDVAILKPEYGVAVTHLEISLVIPTLQRAALEKYLPACLALTPNVVVLELLILPPLCSVSFARTPLPYLEVLKTNLSHRALASFLAIRPRLTALDISSCGRTRKCPLTTISLQHVSDFRCPVDCAPAVVHDRVERLRLDYSRSATLTSAALSQFACTLDRVYVLTVDFGKEDQTILRAIAAHMPQLRHLKLIERGATSSHKHSPRPWKDTSRWSAALRKLTQLDQLLVRTGGSLATVAGDRSAERDLFRKWVGISQPHPTLRHIMIWQHAHLAGRKDVLSEWSRVDGVWEGKWTAKPDATQVTMMI